MINWSDDLRRDPPIWVQIPVLPLPVTKIKNRKNEELKCMELQNLIHIDIKNFNEKTLLSIILLIAGIIFYIAWGATYGVWMDPGIYSVTIILVLGGIFGCILSLMNTTKEN